LKLYRTAPLGRSALVAGDVNRLLA